MRTNTHPPDYNKHGLIYEESTPHTCKTCDRRTDQFDIDNHNGMCYYCWFSPEMIAARRIRQEWDEEEELANTREWLEIKAQLKDHAEDLRDGRPL